MKNNNNCSEFSGWSFGSSSFWLCVASLLVSQITKATQKVWCGTVSGTHYNCLGFTWKGTGTAPNYFISSYGLHYELWLPHDLGTILTPAFVGKKTNKQKMCRLRCCWHELLMLSFSCVTFILQYRAPPKDWRPSAEARSAVASTIRLLELISGLLDDGRDLQTVTMLLDTLTSLPRR